MRVCQSVSQSDRLSYCPLHMLSGHEEVWWPQQDETKMSPTAVPSEVKGKRCNKYCILLTLSSSIMVRTVSYGSSFLRIYGLREHAWAMSWTGKNLVCNLRHGPWGIILIHASMYLCNLHVHKLTRQFGKHGIKISLGLRAAHST